MNGDRFPYDEWVNLALQGVLHRALTTLATQGFSGDHHLFISFDTNHPDVRMPGFLRAQYPDEITIVLQHQFDDLEVADDVFQVSLSFNGQKHRLNVPFAAVRSFADPSVHFGLQINQDAAGTPPTGQTRTRGSVPATRPDTHQETRMGRQVEAKPQTDNDDEIAAVKTAGAGNREHPPAVPAAGAEVITLDAFRKK